MTDRVHILNGDDIDRGLLAEAFGRTGISDYVEDGLDIYEANVDFGNAVVDIPAGKCYIIYNGLDAMLKPDARAGVELATDGTNHVFITYDLDKEEGDRIGFAVRSSNTSPPLPSLRIAEIHMDSQTVARKNQTAPIYRRDAITYKEQDIDSDGDGVVNEADSANHVAGANVSGTVDSAADSQRLGGKLPTGYLRTDADAGGVTGNYDVPPRLGSTWTYRTTDADDQRVATLARINSEGTIDVAIERYPYGGNHHALSVVNRDADEDIFAIRNQGGVDTTGSIHFPQSRPGMQTTVDANNTAATLWRVEGPGPTITVERDTNTDIALRIVKIMAGGERTVPFSVGENGGVNAGGVVSGDRFDGANGVSLGDPDGSGLDISVTGDGYAITPRRDGERRDGQQLRFDAENARWHLESGFVMDGNLDVDGAYLRLPRTTFTPGNASPGAMWFRTDK